MLVHIIWRLYSPFLFASTSSALKRKPLKGFVLLEKSIYIFSGNDVFLFSTWGWPWGNGPAELLPGLPQSLQAAFQPEVELLLKPLFRQNKRGVMTRWLSVNVPSGRQNKKCTHIRGVAQTARENKLWQIFHFTNLCLHKGKLPPKLAAPILHQNSSFLFGHACRTMEMFG